MMNHAGSTIVALSTPPGAGAIGVIRLSGPQAVAIVDALFKGRKKLSEAAGHTLHVGKIADTGNPDESTSQRVNDSTIIDEVVVSVFRAPHSYTGEDVIEISCHGSPYVLKRVLELCIDGGAILAGPGEFTQRAFLHGRMDLTQAEAVADLIAAESRAAQQTAMHQLRGGFSADLKAMRGELIHFSALIELELDFSGEDVQFADRVQLYNLLERLHDSTAGLINSFRLGNALKNGVSVAIIGAPNAGKSTLLNALLNEERAIVSEIAGTTRDTIEEVMNIDGILFRFIDTAGIREHTEDAIERQGIERSRKAALGADVVIYVIDFSVPGGEDEALRLWEEKRHGSEQPFLIALNKTDAYYKGESSGSYPDIPPAWVPISAKTGAGIDDLKRRLAGIIQSGNVQPGDTIITNTRHLAALQKIAAAIADIRAGLDGDIPGDLIALDIRQALHYIGELTGQVVHDRDVLGAIFGKFCIGK